MSDNFEYEKGREAGVKWGERFERERILAWLKKQTLQSQYQGMNWTDACLLLHKNFEQQIQGEK
jgi:hypothetical protein